ncbi:phospholipase C [Streptomyces rimosus subsp. pseudoverticillatus]|uniref:phosphocholine-specific phospholipase C n=1 Tax=Streptomyces rimosus TaxID=1927 RepID=UPI0006B26E1E|nr:phospholipase C, phosphocholine-specific [Streptomyces rimosus]KOT81219.1 phospholipase C [Streptomyces rimosus subsp. pseudoverticillatus]
MPELNRRRFLQLSGGAAAFSVLSESIARAAAIPAHRRTGSIEDVEHIVVLMQENRSFDHYFGTLRGVRGFGDPRPVTLPSGKPVWHQPDGKGKEVLPFRPQVKDDDLGLVFIEDLNHDWTGSHRAFADGRYDQWVPAKTATTMAHLARKDIPFHFALADTFTVCDAYHCSFIGSTDPNRYYLWTGYTGNDGKGVGDPSGPVLGNDEKGYSWTTYPERLEAAGVSWKIYQDIGDGLDAAGHWGWLKNDPYRGNYGDNSLLYFNSFRNAKPGDPLYEKARRGSNVKGGGQLLDDLRADVKNGKLPKISWIACPEAYTEHPSWPANYGAWYISKVLDVLTSDPKVWSKTALFITYDENDGFFDHVVPPYPPADANQGLSTVATEADHYKGGGGYQAGPYGLGQRVPMLVVSPWSTGGYVCSETFDHTSVIRFMERRFGVTEPHISPWRRTVCGDLTSAFDFSRTGKPGTLPDTGGYAPTKPKPADFHPVPPAQGTLPKQERGSRPTRPLRYAPYVDGAADIAAGKYRLTFSGGPDAGAQFHVTAPNRGDGPWTYTTERGKKIADSWNTAYSKGTYDLSVFGPNGFLRTFRGPGRTAGPEVTARHNKASGNLDLTLTNAGDGARTLTVANAYGGASHRITVRPGQRVTHTVDLAAGKRWYDVSVVCDADKTFLRRFAGHVETGAEGVSDPAIRTA